MRTALLPSLLALLAGLASAQTFAVSPRYCAVGEGSGNNSWPFSDYTKWVYQQVHDDLQGQPLVIRELAFRHDGYYGDRPQATAMTLTLRLSSTTVTSATATGVFASNHGNDLTEVLTQAAVSWPIPPTPVLRPRPFFYILPFPAKPFVYKNTPGLCWEVRIHAKSGGTDSLDSGHQNAQYPAYGNYGTGCVATGQTSPATCTSSLKMGAVQGPWTYYGEGRNYPAAQAGIWLVGTSDQRWGPFPLPLDLTPFGAAGCALNTSILVTVAGSTDAAGAFSTQSTPLTIPYDPLLPGLRLFSQVAVADPGRQPLPLVFSNGCENFLHPYDMPLVRICVFNDDTATSTTRILRGEGLVTRFAY